MSVDPIPQQIFLRGDTAANWATKNPVLVVTAEGTEVGVDDAGNLKVAIAGVHWNDLDYTSDPVLASTVASLGGVVSGIQGTLNIGSSGNLSGTYVLDLSAPSQETIVGTSTLTGDTTVTVTGYSPGSQATMTIVQDSVGSHALSVAAGGVTVTPTIPTSGAFLLNIVCTDVDVFVQIANATLIAGTVIPMWTGTISALVNGQLDTTIWPYQSVTSGNLAVLTDPLAVKGTVLSFAIPETG